MTLLAQTLQTPNSPPRRSYEFEFDEIPYACPDFYGVLCCRENKRVACNLVFHLGMNIDDFSWGEGSGDQGRIFAKCIIGYYLSDREVVQTGKSMPELVEILFSLFFDEAISTMPPEGGRLEKKIIRKWLRQNLPKIPAF